MMIELCGWRIEVGTILGGEPKMIYIRNFKKTVWGYIKTEAKTKKEAEKKFDDAEYDEIDNKSDYEFEEWRRD